jgi:hypothetical protein
VLRLLQFICSMSMGPSYSGFCHSGFGTGSSSSDLESWDSGGDGDGDHRIDCFQSTSLRSAGFFQLAQLRQFVVRHRAQFAEHEHRVRRNEGRRVTQAAKKNQRKRPIAFQPAAVFSSVGDA